MTRTCSNKTVECVTKQRNQLVINDAGAVELLSCWIMVQLMPLVLNTYGVVGETHHDL